MSRNLFFTGISGAGKSTVINRALQAVGLCPMGFRTIGFMTPTITSAPILCRICVLRSEVSGSWCVRMASNGGEIIRFMSSCS